MALPGTSVSKGEVLSLTSNPLSPRSVLDGHGNPTANPGELHTLETEMPSCTQVCPTCLLLLSSPAGGCPAPTPLPCAGRRFFPKSCRPPSSTSPSHADRDSASPPLGTRRCSPPDPSMNTPAAPPVDSQNLEEPEGQPRAGKYTRTRRRSEQQGRGTRGKCAPRIPQREAQAGATRGGDQPEVGPHVAGGPVPELRHSAGALPALPVSPSGPAPPAGRQAPKSRDREPLGLCPPPPPHAPPSPKAPCSEGPLLPPTPPASLTLSPKAPSPGNPAPWKAPPPSPGVQVWAWPEGPQRPDPALTFAQADIAVHVAAVSQAEAHRPLGWLETAITEHPAGHATQRFALPPLPQGPSPTEALLRPTRDLDAGSGRGPRAATPRLRTRTRRRSRQNSCAGRYQPGKRGRLELDFPLCGLFWLDVREEEHTGEDLASLLPALQSPAILLRAARCSPGPTWTPGRRRGGCAGTPAQAQSGGRPLHLSDRRQADRVSTGSRRAGSVVVAYEPSRSAACGIFPDQASNPVWLERSPHEDWKLGPSTSSTLSLPAGDMPVCSVRLCSTTILLRHEHIPRTATPSEEAPCEAKQTQRQHSYRNPTRQEEGEAAYLTLMSGQQSPKPDAAPLLKQPNVPGEKHTARQADGRLEMPAWVPVLRDDGSPREPLPAPPPSGACLAHVDALSVSVFHHEHPLPGSSPPSASPSLSSRALLLSLSPHSPSALLSACNCPSAAPTTRILGGAGVWGRAASSSVGRLGPD
ncbi:hypothetical protein J1605_009214 [Eschrichtius robustus]|uniref:Uncharacterized protein n=1 Tax=Eschrichtius robustus TaxID=9764 RepID=A0AB34GVI8_ESCRO|nr:hypothetical protein J1605_009214 [Eschrichtius robustus]